MEIKLMPAKSFAAVALLALAFACKKQPAPAATSAAAPAPAAADAVPADSIRGKVAEKIDVAQYSYLRVTSADGEFWTAVPKCDKAVGDEVVVLHPMWMENFKSSSLNRTWPKIAFGTLADTAAPAPQAAAPMAAAAPAQAPHGAGMFAAEAAGQTVTGAAATMPAGHPAIAAPTDVGPVKVAKASGAQGRTIADIWAQRAQLKDKPVAVRGKVVKAVNGVMGKNWLHLRDGTGKGATADLTVASDQTAKVGDTVVVNGTVHLDRDLGAGYHYDVIVEDAKLKEE